MSVFLDTSALYSLLDRDDRYHPAASDAWRNLMIDEVVILSTNYVLLETIVLAQSRLGIVAAKDVQERITPLIRVEWVGQRLHDAGVAVLLTVNRRRLSLVDCISFIVCRERDVDRVFAFDHHFTEQGFDLLT